MQKSILNAIKTNFKAKKKKEKHYLIAALIAFVGTMFPWVTSGMQYFSISVSGWHSWGFVSVIASAAILAIYLLPFFKIKVPVIFKNKIQEEKILSLMLIAGPTMWLIDMSFRISFLGIGFYVTTIAAGYRCYLVFKK